MCERKRSRPCCGGFGSCLFGFETFTVLELEANVLQKDFAWMVAEWQQFVSSSMRRKDTAQSKDVDTKTFCKWSVSRSFFATEEKLLGKASFTGGQLQKVTTLTSSSETDFTIILQPQESRSDTGSLPQEPNQRHIEFSVFQQQ